jgi:predicted RNase H-like HicB family nuclease
MISNFDITTSSVAGDPPGDRLIEGQMRYPILIEPGTDRTAFGVIVPDLPGCFSAGDTLDEAVTGAEEAVAAWIDAAFDAGNEIPAPSSLEVLRSDPAFEGWAVGVITIGPTGTR